MNSLQANTNDNWFIGEIKFFNEDRGFGFVDCWDDKKEYFIHVTKVKTQPVKESEYVYFRLNREHAKQRTLHHSSQSLPVILLLLKNFTIGPIS